CCVLELLAVGPVFILRVQPQHLASHVCDYRIGPLLTPEKELFPKLPNLQKNRALIHGISIALLSLR
ncbi:MAG TPA: hypothetical protein VHJ56_06675, partial [Candidatus Binatia bacterium]|nr:hypothetical protein [Candidatus Binatia bacterium]